MLNVVANWSEASRVSSVKRRPIAESAGRAQELSNFFALLRSYSQELMRAASAKESLNWIKRWRSS